MLKTLSSRSFLDHHRQAKPAASSALSIQPVHIAAIMFESVDTQIGAPGSVPHALENYLPITKDNNVHTMHHHLQKSELRAKGEIPKSRYEVNGQLFGNRWECMLCHSQTVGAGESPFIFE